MQLSEEQRAEVARRIERSARFQRVFKGADGDYVLEELKKQLLGFDPDPYIHAHNAGKQELYDFIKTCINQDVEKAREALDASSKEKRKTE